MKITKARIENYKSLKKVEFNLDNINFFIGKNNVGKSNIIDALIFLSDVVKGTDIHDLLRNRGGFEQIVFAKKPQQPVQDH